MPSNWEDVLKRLLRRGKVSSAAVLDSDGHVMASLGDLFIESTEGQSLVKAATSNYTCPFSLQLGGTRFTCLHKGQSVLVGSCEEGSVLAGHRTGDGQFFIVGMASSHSPGSCLYEVTESARTLLPKKERQRLRKLNSVC